MVQSWDGGLVGCIEARWREQSVAGILEVGEPVECALRVCIDRLDDIRDFEVVERKSGWESWAASICVRMLGYC